MRFLVVGSTGMLGTDVRAELERRGHEVVTPSSSELDITNPHSVAEGVRQGIDWCINCAAYTAVDKAETEVDAATLLNALAPGYLARACAMAGTRLIYVSTDFVFDGSKTEPYTEEDKTNPLGAYGRTKREGEEAVMASGASALIVRTSWLYGPNGNSFPKTMINAWLAGKNLRVVADQIGTPTYTGDLARVLVDLVELGPEAGIYHAAGPDVMSWHEFARMVIEAYRDLRGLDNPVEIKPIKTEDWPTPAVRPKYSALSSGKLQSFGVEPMRPTREALREFCLRLQ